MTTKKFDSRPEYDFRGGVRGKHAVTPKPIPQPARIDGPKTASARTGAGKASAKAKS